MHFYPSIHPTHQHTWSLAAHRQSVKRESITALCAEKQKHSHCIAETFPISNILNYILLNYSVIKWFLVAVRFFAALILLRWQTNTEQKTITWFCTFSLSLFTTWLTLIRARSRTIACVHMEPTKNETQTRDMYEKNSNTDKHFLSAKSFFRSFLFLWRFNCFLFFSIRYLRYLNVYSRMTKLT